MNLKYEFLILMNKLNRWYVTNEYSIVIIGSILLMSIGLLSIMIIGQ